MSRQTRRTINQLLERHGLIPRRSYGQHFLADPNLIDKVVDTAGVEAGDRVLEVGAGTGALTAALAARGARVLAYEVDRRFRPVLEEVLAGTGVEVRYEDALEADLAEELAGGDWRLVANLPYNVGTPLVMEVLLSVPVVVSLTVMLQKEVVDRLVARPGSDDYGSPSLVVALTARVVDRFTVPPHLFVPPPPVSSAVVRLDRVERPEGLAGAVSLARTAFGQRRKMLRRSLDGIVTPDAFERVGLAGELRPEDVSPEGFLALAREVGSG